MNIQHTCMRKITIMFLLLLGGVIYCQMYFVPSDDNGTCVDWIYNSVSSYTPVIVCDIEAEQHDSVIHYVFLPGVTSPLPEKTVNSAVADCWSLKTQGILLWVLLISQLISLIDAHIYNYKNIITVRLWIGWCYTYL